MTSRVRAALVGAYVVATFLSFPHPVAGRVLDLGLVASWLSPALLLLALDGLAPRRALGVAFAGALAAHTAILHWIWVVTVVYGHAPAIAGVAGPLSLGAYIASFTALFGLGASLLARRGLASPFALAALWTALDHFRSFAFTGFPWATLGYAQHHNGAMLGLASITGVYGLSFVVVLGGAALAEIVRSRRAGRRPGPVVWAALGGVVLAHAGGLLAAPSAAPDAPTVRVAVLQGNIDQGVKWSPVWADRTLAIYEELSREAVQRGAEVVVWPETAVPGAVERDPDLAARLVRLARDTGASYVLGAVGIEIEPGATRPNFYDSAFLLEPDRGFTERYDKSHLVPFGEYVPLRDLLGTFLRAVARGIAADNVTPGPGPASLPLAVSGAGADPLTAGVPICYELLFPDLVRRFVGDGAELLFAITNDAWYGRTGAPYQFLAITALRSAETGVWTARAANTGVSAFIDERGRVRAQTPIFERGLLVEDVPLRPPPAGGSFYTRHGDVFAGACWLAVAILAIVGRTRRSSGGAAGAGTDGRAG